MFVLAACGGGGSSNSSNTTSNATINGGGQSTNTSGSSLGLAFAIANPSVKAVFNRPLLLASINAQSLKFDNQTLSSAQFNNTSFKLVGINAPLFSIKKVAQNLNLIFNEDSKYLATGLCSQQQCQASLQASLGGKTANLAIQVNLVFPPITFSSNVLNGETENKKTALLASVSPAQLLLNGKAATLQEFANMTFSLAGTNKDIFTLSRSNQSLHIQFNTAQADIAPNTCINNICVAKVNAQLNGNNAQLEINMQVKYVFEFATKILNKDFVKNLNTPVIADIASHLRYNKKVLSASQKTSLSLALGGVDAKHFDILDNKLLYVGGDCKQITCAVNLQATLTSVATAQTDSMSLSLESKVGSINSVSLDIDGNTRQYVNLDNGKVQSTKFNGWDLYIEREAIVLNKQTKSAYLNSSDFTSASIGAVNLVQTKAYGNPSKTNKPSLFEWNRNWFGKSVFGVGINGQSMDFNTNPFAGLYSPSYAVSDVNGKDMLSNDLNGTDKLTYGLFYPRRENINGSYVASNDKKDFVAIPQNQLIIRTSKGSKFVRLRAIQSYDYNDANGETIANNKTNNIYFKYAIQDLAAGDTSFGAERDMCVSFTTGAREPKYQQYQSIIKDSKWSVGIGRFKYGFMHSDGYYKQTFIDFDKIIQGPGNTVVDFNGTTANVNGNTYNVIARDGSSNTYPEVANYNTSAATRMYSEGCMPAFWNDRQAGRYPDEYLNGFAIKGGDTPLHNRRADWLIDHPDATQTTYKGEDEWDIAVGVLVRTKNFNDFANQTGIVYAPIVVNSGRAGDNQNGTLRSKGGLAAMVMVTGTGLNNYSPTDALDAHTDAKEAANYTPVTSISDSRVVGKWQASGRSMVARYNHIKVDYVSGSPVITTNKRVYAIATDQSRVRKVQVSRLKLTDNKAEYQLTYE